MKRCPKCGYQFPDKTDKCGICKGDLVQISVDNNNTFGIKIGRIVLALFALVIVIFLITTFDGKSQYEKDYESMQNKTYNEMIGGEQQVFEDELEWELENADE